MDNLILADVLVGYIARRPCWLVTTSLEQCTLGMLCLYRQQHCWPVQLSPALGDAHHGLAVEPNCIVPAPHRPIWDIYFLVQFLPLRADTFAAYVRVRRELKVVVLRRLGAAWRRVIYDRNLYLTSLMPLPLV